MGRNNRRTGGRRGRGNVGGVSIVVLVFAALFVLAQRYLPDDSGAEDVPTAYSEEGLRVHYIDVGQGDSIFLECGGKTMLIDAGEREYGSVVKEYIAGLGYSDIDYLVGTHPHDDHIGGLAEVIGSFGIGTVLMPDVLHDTKTYEDTLDALIEKGLSAVSPKPGDSFSLGGAEMTVIAPYEIDEENMNNNSICLKAVCEGRVFLFMGDAETPVESDILDASIDIAADVLKVGHHGSYTSSGSRFLKAAQPGTAVISLGAGNSYGHPHDETLEKLNASGVDIYRTDESGTIVVDVVNGGIKIYTEGN